MLTTYGMAITILVVAVCTFITRVIPFAFFGKREVPKFIKYLGNILPPAIIGILIIYCIKDSFSDVIDYGTLSAQIIGITITVIIHLWKRNTLLSIAGGTITYMLLIHFVFI